MRPTYVGTLAPRPWRRSRVGTSLGVARRPPPRQRQIRRLSRGAEPTSGIRPRSSLRSRRRSRSSAVASPPLRIAATTGSARITVSHASKPAGADCGPSSHSWIRSSGRSGGRSSTRTSASPPTSDSRTDRRSKRRRARSRVGTAPPWGDQPRPPEQHLPEPRAEGVVDEDGRSRHGRRRKQGFDVGTDRAWRMIAVDEREIDVLAG